VFLHSVIVGIFAVITSIIDLNLPILTNVNSFGAELTLSAKLKIVYIIVSLETGGAQSMLIRLLKCIDKDRFDVIVISLTDTGELGQSVIDLGVPLITIGMTKNLFNIFALIRLYGAIRKTCPDVVHTWMYHSDLIGGLLARLLCVPRIVWGVRSADFFSSDTSLSTKLIVKVCAWLSTKVPHAIVYNSRKGLDHHNSLGYTKNNSHVIYNCVDTDRFKPQSSCYINLRRELNVADNRKIIGIVARYDYLKNHTGFIEMAKFVNDYDKDCDFLMIGANIKNNKPLISLVRDRNILDNFHLWDSVPDIENIIGGLDAVIITSSSEAFPNVLIESMACGVPCFSTDVGDVRQVIYDKDWVVPIGDMKKLADVCIQYLELDMNIQKQIKDNIAQEVCQHFNSALMMQKYELIYAAKI